MGLGRPWGRHGRPRSIFDGFGVDFEVRSMDLGSILKSVLVPQTDQNRSKIDAKMHSDSASVFGSIWGRFGVDFGIHLGIIFGSCWASYGGSAK